MAKKTLKQAPSLGARGETINVRRLHRRDCNRAWEFLKQVFRSVNKNTLEYQRPRTKHRFMEIYESQDTEQILFEVTPSRAAARAGVEVPRDPMSAAAPARIVGYAECSSSPAGADNWVNPRYFEKRGMRPFFVDELAVDLEYQGRGVGSFILEQLQHLARANGCTHLVLEVAQNNKDALTWYHKRKFFRLDAAIFLAQKVPVEPELLPARQLKPKRDDATGVPAKSARPRSARSSASDEGTKSTATRSAPTKSTATRSAPTKSAPTKSTARARVDRAPRQAEPRHLVAKRVTPTGE